MVTGFFYKLTYSHKYRRAHLYNFGCNYACKWCYYRLKPPAPKVKLSVDEVERALELLKDQRGMSRLHFLGGEPTINPHLIEIISYAKNTLGVRTVLITNCSNPIPDGIDRISVSLKAVSEELHKKYTGKPAAPVLRNFIDAYMRGIDVHACAVYIPGLIEIDEIERIAKFIASVDDLIPFYIIGYIPVPGAPWRKPTDDEVKRAKEVAERYLKYVAWSNLTADKIKYDSEIILGS